MDSAHAIYSKQKLNSRSTIGTEPGSYCLLRKQGRIVLGKRDTITKKYLEQPEIFADAFNYYLFKGRKVIKPEDLKEQDPTELIATRKLGMVQDLYMKCLEKSNRRLKNMSTTIL